MNCLLVSTRKGLVVYTKENGSWKYRDLHFKGIPVTMAYYDEDSTGLCGPLRIMGIGA